MDSLFVVASLYCMAGSRVTNARQPELYTMQRPLGKMKSFLHTMKLRLDRMQLPLEGMQSYLGSMK
ncbi:MAG: hypothetical protein H6Q17_402 [Bacteroidetes bacterium]|nr:hypothetical protein [Bacteroidota bacterium]